MAQQLSGPPQGVASTPEAQGGGAAVTDVDKKARNIRKVSVVYE